MKLAPHATILVTALLAGWSGMASATEYGTVVSSTPVLSQVPTGQRLCSDEQVQTAPRTSGAGAVAGALIGGAVGNQIGAGVGRAAATGLGLVLGAAVGDHAEANAAGPAVSTVQRCRTVTQYQDQVIGYDVVYDYHGQRRSARLPQDPGGAGTKIALEVNVVPSASGRSGRPVPPAGAQPPRGASYDDDGYATEPVYAAPPARVVAYPPAYYAPAPVYVTPAPVYYGYPGPTVWIGGRWVSHGGYHHHRW
ncbi:MAG: glycine zipper 2TM domain-containing protein [Rhizobacter sp.]